MPTNQRADARPISFVLHDMSVNAAPIVFPLVIRPEDLTRSDQSRLTVHQTLGGAWADSFGAGVPTVTIAGTTGWGGGGRPDGFEQFQELYTTIWRKWHALRESAARTGRDPDLVRLIFVDGLDDFTWLVAPQNFVLRRNKSRPLLSQYQITLVKLGDTLVDGPTVDAPFGGALEALGLGSLSGSLATIQAFAENISGAVAAALGPIKAGLKQFVKMTADVLFVVKTLIQSGKDFLSFVSGPILDVARLASQAAHNVMCIAANIQSISTIVRAKFMQVSTAFKNVYCVLKNVFKARRFYPDFSNVYGASTCSSTNGGSIPSAYAGDEANVWQDIYSRRDQKVSVSPQGGRGLVAMANMDVTTTPNLAAVAPMMTAATAGVQISGVN